jgi:hypothetical protein
MIVGDRVLLDDKPGTISGIWDDDGCAGYDVKMDNGDHRWVMTFPSGAHRLKRLDRDPQSL